MSRAISESYTAEFRAERAKALASSGLQPRRPAAEPPMGETVVITTAMQGHGQVFRLSADRWWATFATRRTALEFCLQNNWRIDRDATVNQFSGGSPPGEQR